MCIEISFNGVDYDWSITFTDMEPSMGELGNTLS